ncbi:hypothetical protein CFC21_101990 [Triticum aestivum]|uniref:DUF632 domain-containing protein n=3 Tax=Triticum TaxID=4564 RepID=A0A9R0ZWZ9_TRITD|nr:hypothetical protein CFC21_101990 [Triticum aestivum]VAI84654.1 unnamed protein product [Triticum turgidum subsp. durum]
MECICRQKRVRLLYEKKCARLRSQGANGAESFAIKRTKAAISDHRIKLNISLASVNALFQRVVAVHDEPAARRAHPNAGKDVATHRQHALGDVAHSGLGERAPLVVGHMVGGRHQGLAATGADKRTIYIDISYFAKQQDICS